MLRWLGRVDEATRLAHLAAIVTGSDDAIVSKDLNGIIQSWNIGAERLFGFTSEEAVGRPMTIVFPRDRLPEEDIILARIRKGERLDHYETVRQRKNGELIDVSVTVSPIRDATGRIVGASKIARDITAAKSLERQLKEANRRLQELDAERRAFLNLVAHELRTPLLPILVQVEILRQSGLAAGAGDGSLAMIQRNMERLTSLIEQVLSANRMEGAALPLRLARVDLCQLVQETAAVFRGPAQKGAVEIRAVCEPALVLGDADRLMQVLTNLLSNALKFTSEGHIDVRVGSAEGKVLVEVQDTGPGFVPGQERRLFKPFARLQEKKPGTGLGLYISRAIALQHGGDLAAQSAGPGRGATFTLSLPALDEATMAEARQDPLLDPAEAGGPFPLPGAPAPRRGRPASPGTAAAAGAEAPGAAPRAPG